MKIISNIEEVQVHRWSYFFTLWKPGKLHTKNLIEYKIKPKVVIMIQ